MATAPVEILAVAFPGSRFNGAILPELRRLVDSATITIVDGVLVTRTITGELVWHEFAETDDGLGALLTRVDGLLSDDDIAEVAATLEPGSSAAVLAFENTWMTGLWNALSDSGGIVLSDVQVPAEAVEQILASVPDED